MDEITPLTEGDIHIWQADAAGLAPQQMELSALLSPDEEARARAFHTDRQRDHYICRRGLLRHLLGAYAGRDPQALRFDYGPYGKPALTEDSSLSFSVSHSGDLLVMTFTLNQPVGVDVEQIRPVENLDTLARRTLTADEYRHFLSLLPDLRLNVFFAYWTVKEAIMKASGRGLNLPAAQIGIEWVANGSPRLACIAGDPAASSRWHLRQIALGPEYAAALAVDGQVAQVTVYRWPDHVDI
ncbi:MAG: 4'-phosphopantetheinyl transferase superfamily protein [Anaerolineae bacterium]|nr:4'-phosphopantetheinyl transferase superfamily protein [Anaerolineae bacterium]